jgi:hypothetical protein
MQPAEVDEDLLRYILRLVWIGEDSVGDSDHTGVFSCKKRLKRFVFSQRHGDPSRLEIYHC